MRRAAWFLCLLLLSGCSGGDEGDGDADGDVDADSDVDADADGDSDADGDADADADADGGSCEAPSLLGTTFEIAPDLADGQIHPTGVFDGETAWIGFTMVEEGTSLFDTWLIGIGCDGAARVEPFRVNTDVVPNDIDPVLALDGDRLLVLWSADTGVAPDNMQTRYRVLGLDGPDPMEEDARLQTTRGGELVVANAFHPAAVSLPGGGFAVAGARGLDGMTVLQAYVQRLDRDGAFDGEAVDGFIEADIGQAETALATAGDDGLAMAWTRYPDDGEVVWKMVDDGTTEPEALAPEAPESGTASMATDPADSSQVYLAYVALEGSGATIHVVDVGASGTTRPSIELGQSGRMDYAPTMAVGPNGPVVGWFRNTGGSANEIVVVGLTRDGDALTASEETVIAPFASAPGIYGMALMPVAADIALVVWAEGASPAFRLYGRFLRLR